MHVLQLQPVPWSSEELYKVACRACEAPLQGFAVWRHEASPWRAPLVSGRCFSHPWEGVIARDLLVCTLVPPTCVLPHIFSTPVHLSCPALAANSKKGAEQTPALLFRALSQSVRNQREWTSEHKRQIPISSGHLLVLRAGRMLLIL